MMSVPEMLEYFQLAGTEVQKQDRKSGSHACTTKHFLFMSVTFIVTQPMNILPTQ
jgi:hypothetical protein